MTEYTIWARTLPKAYHEALRCLNFCGEEVPCPDYNTEQKEITLTMIVEHPLKEPMISRLMIGGPRELEQYRQEILDGILDFEIERGNWAYTYHDRIAKQIPFIISELKRNPHSRRAVIIVRDWEADSRSTDPACLQHIQYFVRDNKLHCKLLFRSNDACKATFMNAFALIMLQKRIADELGYEVGTYTHRANSFHCYAADYNLLDGYVERYLSGKETTYDYDGEWVEGFLTGALGGGFWIDESTKLGVPIIRTVDPDTVGECTGLRDKNGKLIFEGDIFRSDADIWIVDTGTVHYDDGGWCVNNNFLQAFMWGGEVRGVIIGNVHDNHELLKGGEGDGTP